MVLMLCHTSLAWATDHAESHGVPVIETHRLREQCIIVELKLGHIDLLGLLLSWCVSFALAAILSGCLDYLHWRGCSCQTFICYPHQLLRLHLVQFEKLLVLRLEYHAYRR